MFCKKRINIEINVGDKVIDNYGLYGEIIHICYCANCMRRGFYEPTVKWESGEETTITCYDRDLGFSDFYQIGKNIFASHLVEIQEIDKIIDTEKKEIDNLLKRQRQLLKQKERLQELKSLK